MVCSRNHPVEFNNFSSGSSKTRATSLKFDAIFRVGSGVGAQACGCRVSLCLSLSHLSFPVCVPTYFLPSFHSIRSAWCILFFLSCFLARFLPPFPSSFLTCVYYASWLLSDFPCWFLFSLAILFILLPRHGVVRMYVYIINNIIVVPSLVPSFLGSFLPWFLPFFAFFSLA